MLSNLLPSILQNFQNSPYTSYTYAYPHKTAYRHFSEPIPLADLWRQEDRQSVFLYMHVPFCEMRCGFCNLFTTANPADNFVMDYLKTLRREAEQVRQHLDQSGGFNTARVAIGGGTPTFLNPDELEQLFAISEDLFAVSPGSISMSVETSPLTATLDRLEILRGHGADRISIGVQSFLEHEARGAGRAQKTSEVHQALENIRSFDFAALNIDLIYGLPGQTVDSWLASLRSALQYKPEELYLYPLYVRPLTGLDRMHKRANLAQQSGHSEDIRLECYQAARDLLLVSGYIQVSMRMFQAKHSPVESGPIYCVQDDGMIGLGCGARSYTRTHHYSNEYAVGARGVQAILTEYIATPTKQFAYARYGFQLNEDEQHRRYVLKSLLEAGGLDRLAYQQRFGQDVCEQLPELQALVQSDLVTNAAHMMTLTAQGLAYSDAIGPWLYSANVQALMEGYELR
jgi:oxygen-independent coproporphyrinogen-3 oxidase